MIWLIGNKGMLGSEVEKLLKEQGLTYWASDKEVDVGDYKALEKFAKDKKIKWIINCAGYTKVDKAEEEIDEAFRINKDGVRNIALFSSKRQIILIHISTDYIFDGDKDDVRGYREDDKANPLSVYGKSKLAGEKEIQKILEEYFILRTAWLYGLNGHNFIFTMLRLFQKKEKVEVVDDQRGSPTYANDLAEVILKIIQSGSKKYGIYHFSNEGVTNWHEFTRAIYSKAKKLDLISDGKKVEIKAIKTEEYPTAAARPKNSILSKDKIKKEFNLKIRNWDKALEDFLSTLSLRTK
jgi:dTDP-4-dehydrorhamnose reductase